MIERIFALIESTQTTARVNVISGRRGFVRALASLYEVRQLARLRDAEPSAPYAVLMRLAQLCDLDIDPRFENPNDIPIAAYLLVLSKAEPDIFRAALDRVAAARNCWWSSQLVELANSGSLSETEITEAVQIAVVLHEGELGNIKLVSLSNSTESGDAVVPWARLIDPNAILLHSINLDLLPSSNNFTTVASERTGDFVSTSEADSLVASADLVTTV